MQETDSDLLTRFVTRRDESAFRELTERYLGLIYHVALRRTGNRQIAEEVSQNVLCAVVRKAAGLAKHPDRLPAWLHRATLFESTKAMRSEAAHQRRKQLVHPDGIASTGDEDSSLWNSALPALDLALDRLPDTDRHIVLRHYFEGKSFQQIGGEVSRPAATVQKQCRRALDKLSRILRGKGVMLSAATLATGLSIQSAKAAPPALSKSAAAKALAGASSHSTISLTLFMAMKSKATLPIALLILLSPLGLQQFAISRATEHNERLRESLAAQDPANRRPASAPNTRIVSTGQRRITIDMLHHAQKEADRSVLKEIEFREMLASLQPEELETLIPQADALSVPRDEKMDLFRLLVAQLAKTDPGKAVRSAAAVGFDRISIANTGVDSALFAWASADPDGAIGWYQDWTNAHPDDTGLEYLPLKAAVAAALILADSPRVREIMTLADGVNPSYVLRDAMGFVREENPVGDVSDHIVEVFGKFLPWIREIAPEERSKRAGGTEIDRREAFERLFFESHVRTSPLANPVPGKILNAFDLLPSERRIIVEYQAQEILNTFYNTRPAPDRVKVELAARDWLQKSAPDEAEEIFTKSKTLLADRERLQITGSLQNLASREVIRDSDIIQDLERHDFTEFPELLPQALEQAGRIKDSAKRAEMINQLQKPTQ